VRLLLISFITFNILVGSVNAERNLNSEYCSDSKAEFVVFILKGNDDWVKKTKKCQIAKTDSATWCRYTEFKRNCPVICESCPSLPCEDKTGTVVIPPKDKIRDCQAIYPQFLCKKYEYAMHCPVTCNFCPYTPTPTHSPLPSATSNPTILTPTATTRFTKTDESSGLVVGGKFGSQVTTASSGKGIFIAEYQGANTLDVYEYETDQYRLVTKYDNFANDGYENTTNTELATTEDGNNVICAYTTIKDRGKVVILHRTGGGDRWKVRGQIFFNSFKSEDKLPRLSADISDDGNTIMVADHNAVHVYDYITSRNKNKWKPRVRNGLAFDEKILTVSMTPNGLVVAISFLLSVGTIKLYEWEEMKWKQFGRIKPRDGGELGPFTTMQFAGNRLFTGMSSAFEGAGAIYVYDMASDINSETDVGTMIMKGTKTGDKVGRKLSVSLDGKFVAWASESRAGVVEWDKGKWLVQDALTFSRKPRVALDSSAKYLAVGLPFANRNKGKLEIFKRST